MEKFVVLTFRVSCTITHNRMQILNIIDLDWLSVSEESFPSMEKHCHHRK
jgi:hypothetical protein